MHTAIALGFVTHHQRILSELIKCSFETHFGNAAAE